MTLKALKPREYRKDPDDIMDYEIDWAGPVDLGGPWLQDAETITDSSWLLADGITMTDHSHTDTTATVWLSGGSDGASYLATNRIITSAGRQKDRSILIKVFEA